MGVPTEPVLLSSEEVASLVQKVSDLRHSVNNHLTLISTAIELIRRKPDSLPRMLESMCDQPEQIRDELASFGDQLDVMLGVTRE